MNAGACSLRLEPIRHCAVSFLQFLSYVIFFHIFLLRFLTTLAAKTSNLCMITLFEVYCDSIFLQANRTKPCAMQACSDVHHLLLVLVQNDNNAYN